VVELGFALQLVTVRYLGCFLADPLAVPTEVVDVVAAQLEISDPSCVKRYTEREKTRLDHGQPVVFSEKSPLHAVFAGQQGSTEVLRER
jgi:hypothetical protein